jgi:hypothetical protein
VGDDIVAASGIGWRARAGRALRRHFQQLARQLGKRSPKLSVQRVKDGVIEAAPAR